MNDAIAGKQPSAFWPVALVALSLLILLTWNVGMTAKQRSVAIKIRDQQSAQLNDAGQAEAKLQLMMSELLNLAKTDGAAAGVVKRHGITLNQPRPAQAAQPQ